MKKKILSTLKQIEKEHKVKVLYACETGSRAWGFASPDSDYDVRFIYMHQMDWYLSLSEKKDTIETMLDERILDLSGWDLRKSLRLLKNSNIALFERFISPEVYMADEYFMKKINKILPLYFSSISGMYHYLSMATGFMQEMDGEADVKLKSYFYALRSTLSSLWIKEYQTMPPIEFKDLLFLLSKEQKKKVKELLKIKQEVDEKYFHPREEVLDNFISNTLEECKLIANNLPGSKRDNKLLDEVFVKVLNKNN